MCEGCKQAECQTMRCYYLCKRYADSDVGVDYYQPLESEEEEEL